MAKQTGALDPYLAPAYGIPEASALLHVPRTTLRAWVKGQGYDDSQRKRFVTFVPVLSLPPSKGQALSFTNLVEAHVLEALRRRYKIPLPKTRKTIEYLQKEFGSKHPLAEYRFQTDGIDLFLKHNKELINVSSDGQLAVERILGSFLERIEWENGHAIRFYPFLRRPSGQESEPRLIVIDPRISFGRPALEKSWIPVDAILDRFRGGETTKSLSADYREPEERIEEVIRHFYQRAA